MRSRLASAFAYFKLHPVAFAQDDTIGHFGDVHKHIGAARVWRYKTETSVVIEEFYLSSLHFLSPSFFELGILRRVFREFVSRVEIHEIPHGLRNLVL